MKQILCYGDSNTWGLIAGTKKRYPWGVRWTTLLQEKLKDKDIRVLEEGLCGRTTVFEDAYRENRNGLKALPLILETHSPIDFAVIMLGTNDCKTIYNVNAFQIAKGLSRCIDKLLEYIPAEKILIVSPIHLGEDVWKESFDPEFDRVSVAKSKELQSEYQKIADEKKIRMIAASDYALPSLTDQEHMDPEGHAAFAEAIFQKLVEMKI